MPTKFDTPDPTESELAILQVLWRKGPSTVREVWGELEKKCGYTTVLKFLQIMLEKKLVRRDEAKLTHVYAAAVAQSTTQERLVAGLMNRAFGGSASGRTGAAGPVGQAGFTQRKSNAIRALLPKDTGGRP